MYENNKEMKQRQGFKCVCIASLASFGFGSEMLYLAVMEQDIQLLISSGSLLVLGCNLVSHLFSLSKENAPVEKVPTPKLRILETPLPEFQHLEYKVLQTPGVFMATQVLHPSIGVGVAGYSLEGDLICIKSKD
ncbi:hypothetical protein [Vibrio parahaemolyticus]|uniref:hypothetical protein n=1 Tax=Vibrio parahaemolyticus TaxID=670 RepID=UPI0023EC7955|nr:hypothetical protein [Vibrio parahaemolyticus]